MRNFKYIVFVVFMIMMLNNGRANTFELEQYVVNYYGIPYLLSPTRISINGFGELWLMEDTSGHFVRFLYDLVISETLSIRAKHLINSLPQTLSIMAMSFVTYTAEEFVQYSQKMSRLYQQQIQ